MIVNPQLFNYEIISTSLMVTIACLAVFKLNFYQASKAEHHLIEEEKKLVDTQIVLK